MYCRLSLPNNTFGHLMPPEDYYESDGSAFIVADGITRDPNCDIDLIDKNLVEALKYYPNPSGARFAAETVCASFIEAIQEGESIFGALKKSNNAVKNLNNKNVQNVDFLINDYWGCVASSAVIRGNKLKWGVIGDCEVIVFSKGGEVKFRSPNSMAVFEKAVEDKKITFKWEKPEGRVLVRSKYRNKPNQLIDGKCVSYGAITGEKNAEKFFCTGDLELAAGDLVLIYTDGFTPTILHDKFFQVCRSENISEFEQKFVPFNAALVKENALKFGKERTLLGFIYS